MTFWKDTPEKAALRKKVFTRINTEFRDACEKVLFGKSIERIREEIARQHAKELQSAIENSIWGTSLAAKRDDVATPIIREALAKRRDSFFPIGDVVAAMVDGPPHGMKPGQIYVDELRELDGPFGKLRYWKSGAEWKACSFDTESPLVSLFKNLKSSKGPSVNLSNVKPQRYVIQTRDTEETWFRSRDVLEVEEVRPNQLTVRFIGSAYRDEPETYRYPDTVLAGNLKRLIGQFPGSTFTTEYYPKIRSRIMAWLKKEPSLVEKVETIRRNAVHMEDLNRTRVRALESEIERLERVVTALTEHLGVDVVRVPTQVEPEKYVVTKGAGKKKSRK